jgi:ABC-2 type transport system permease protein
MSTAGVAAAQRQPAPSTRSVLARTCSAEWTRLWTVRTTWWFLAVAAVLMLGLGTLLGFESAADPAEIQGEPAWTTARFIAMPAQFAFLGLVLLSVTADYTTGGIVPTLQWTPRRTVLFLARTAVTVATATTIGVLLTVGAAVAARSTAGEALTLSVDDGVPMVGKVAVVYLAGTLLAAGLGFLIRNTAGALIAVFLLVLVLPLILPLFGDWMATVARALPGSGAIHLLTDGAQDMTVTSSVVVLTVWALGASAAGLLRLVRSDATQ